MSPIGRRNQTASRSAPTEIRRVGGRKERRSIAPSAAPPSMAMRLWPVRIQASIKKPQVATQAAPMRRLKRRQSRSARQPEGASGTVTWQITSARVRRGTNIQSAARVNIPDARSGLWLKWRVRSHAARTPTTIHGKRKPTRTSSMDRYRR